MATLARTASSRRLSVGSPLGNPATVVATSGGVDTLAPVPPDVVTPLSGSGVATKLRDALLVLDRHELVLALGKFAVIHNAHTQELTLLSGQQPPPPHAQQSDARSHKRGQDAALGEITAMALDGKRLHISVCRAAVGAGVGATVSIHALKGFSTPATSARRQHGTKLKTLSWTGTDRFCGTALSTDGKLACCQSANASWTLVVWDWSRDRQIAVADVHSKVSRVRFNVIDMAQLSTSGGNQLKLWTLSEYTLKSFASFNSGDETRVRHGLVSYTDHVWLPEDCLVALLDDGSVQLIVNGELLQTVQALPTGSRAHCIVAQNNGEAGVIVGGSDGAITLLRIVTELMKTNEKEMHVQRRMTMSNAQQIYGMGVDATGSLLVCCTDRFYGSYDLSHQCLLLGVDELLSLNPMASTPFITQIKGCSLSAASRRPCFTALAKLTSGEDSFLVWNQLDGHECFLHHPLEAHSSPACLDIHPSGMEIAVALRTKVVVFFLLQDTVKIAFELLAKNVSHLRYSTSGAYMLLAQSSIRTISVYCTFSRDQRKPELHATFQDIDGNLNCLDWSISDRSFFVSEQGDHAKIRHCRLLANDRGDVEDGISIQSTTKLLDGSRSCVGFASCRIQSDSHDYVFFATEEMTAAAPNISSSHSAGTNKSRIRAWLNGSLDRDALISNGHVGMVLPHDVTTICAGPGKMLLAGTTHGMVILLYWRHGRLNPDGTRNIYIMATQRCVDLHVSAVVGLTYTRSTKLLLSSDAGGVVLVSFIKRSSDTDGQDPQFRQHFEASNALHNFDEEVVFTEPSKAFTSVCQADEIAVFDRNAIELRKLKQMDIESELQQVKLENDMLNKQLQDVKRGFGEQMKSEFQKQIAQSEIRESALKNEWASRLNLAEHNREESVAQLRHNAQMARDQYLASADQLQSECIRLKDQLISAQQHIEDLILGNEEKEILLRRNYESKLQEAARVSHQEQQRLQAELDDANSQLREVLVQIDQDHLTQLLLLSSSVDHEKTRASDQLSQIQGKTAALHQEVKMLLAALNQKDHELQQLRDQHDQDEDEIAELHEQLSQEKEHGQALRREKQELLAAAHEEKLIRDNLQRLNNVHRSQIEMLHNNLLPKDRELERMQQHLSELYTTNEEVVVQANLSDRLRKESVAKAKQKEIDVEETHKLLEHVQSSVFVLQDELGELVKQSVVQEKSAIVGEIMRIHKRITRQMDVLRTRDGRVEQVSAELHRQNRFLLKSKQQLRHQAEISHKEKHKLVAALSFQNATLMNDINVLRKENKELSRMMRCHYSPLETTAKTEEAVSSAAAIEDGVGVDGRQALAHAIPAVYDSGLHRAGSASSRGPTRLQQMARRSSVRPKSAAAARPTGLPLRR